MAETGPLQVVVIDDVVRFALHVWRYLSQNVGFGIGLIPGNDQHYFNQGDGPVGLPTPDGRARVWWVPAGSWRKQLEQVQEQIGKQYALFLVDLKAPKAPEYDAGEVVACLRESAGIDDSSIWRVSSYASPWADVRPKCLDLLRQIERRLPAPRTLIEIGREGVIDVLVTGAGFERGFEHQGEAARKRSRLGEKTGPGDRGFGLPSTDKILQAMGPPFKTEIKLPSPAKALSDNFSDPTLDDWWDLLLETELRRRLQPVRRTAKSGNAKKGRRRAKREAYDLERRLREAFRQALLRHDWGHMRQSVNAACLPWRAWLTTNYTRFADRAIALAVQSKARKDTESRSAPDWRVVSTSNEALSLLRELQDRDGVDGSDEPKPAAHVFKLHGDISHLTTMVIAGHDKEFYNSLSFPVDSLHQVYTAAGKYLLGLVEEVVDEPSRQMVCHIVGHGLKDRALVKILVDAARACPAGQILFRVVDRNPQEVKEVLERALEPVFRAPDRAAPEVQSIDEVSDAESYLARLKPGR